MLSHKVSRNYSSTSTCFSRLSINQNSRSSVLRPWRYVDGQNLSPKGVRRSRKPRGGKAMGKELGKLSASGSVVRAQAVQRGGRWKVNKGGRGEPIGFRGDEWH
jgi:hypothetical protein